MGLLLFLLLLFAAVSASVDVQIRVSNAQVSPDGGPPRLGVHVNGKYGGPLIAVKSGDLLNVTLINDYDNPPFREYFGGTSVHFHGFSMRGVPFLDGVSYVSQCPVRRGERQVIEFTVDEEPGTYMWHDHKNMAVADGLAGGLIVTGEADEALKARFNVTRDEVLVVSDFFEQNSVTQAKDINAPANVSDFTWNARSLLLDWRGCFKDCSPGDEGMFSCDPDKDCSERYILNVAPGDVIRLRIIAAGSMMYVLTSTVVRAPRLSLSHSRYALRASLDRQVPNRLFPGCRRDAGRDGCAGGRGHGPRRRMRQRRSGSTRRRHHQGEDVR